MALGDDYITTADLKGELGITDSVDDPELALAITSTTQWINTYCNRDFNQAASATARVFDPLNAYRLYVDDISTTTGLVIKTDENDDGTFETTWASTDYQLEPLNGWENGQTWPYTAVVAIENRCFPRARRATVEVTASWGWATVPDTVKKACMVQASRLYKRRFSPEGVLGGIEGMGPVRVGHKLDPDVAALLSPYRRTPAPVA